MKMLGKLGRKKKNSVQFARNQKPGENKTLKEMADLAFRLSVFLLEMSAGLSA